MCCCWTAIPAMHMTSNSSGSCRQTGYMWCAILPTPLTVCNQQTGPSSRPWNITGMRKDGASCGQQEGEWSSGGRFFIVWESMKEGNQSLDCPSWLQGDWDVPCKSHGHTPRRVWDKSDHQKATPACRKSTAAWRKSTLAWAWGCQRSLSGLGRKWLLPVGRVPLDRGQREVFVPPADAATEEERIFRHTDPYSYKRERPDENEVQSPLLSPNQWWPFCIHCLKETKPAKKTKKQKTRKMEGTRSDGQDICNICKRIQRRQRIGSCTLFVSTGSLRHVAGKMASLKTVRHSLALAVLNCRLTYCSVPYKRETWNLVSVK